jgi:hypothetical protein
MVQSKQLASQRAEYSPDLKQSRDSIWGRYDIQEARRLWKLMQTQAASGNSERRRPKSQLLNPFNPLH